MRTARELHDVVTHHRSVISVQARMAAVFTSDPDTAHGALRTIAETSSEGLEELRRMRGGPAYPLAQPRDEGRAAGLSHHELEDLIEEQGRELLRLLFQGHLDLRAGVAKLLKRHGWSCQVPVRHAIERDEEAIEIWTDEVWPRLKGLRRTWAPTSVVRTRRARG